METETELLGTRFAFGGAFFEVALVFFFKGKKLDFLFPFFGTIFRFGLVEEASEMQFIAAVNQSGLSYRRAFFVISRLFLS